MSKELNVCIFVDFWGCGGDTPEDEMDGIEQSLRDDFGLDLGEVIKTIDPTEAVEEKYDLLVFDYGGVMPGCGDLVYSIVRSVIKWADANINSAVLVWSEFTADTYMSELNSSFRPEEHKNIFFHLDAVSDEEDEREKKMVEDLKVWLGVG